MIKNINQHKKLYLKNVEHFYVFYHRRIFFGIIKKTGEFYMNNIKIQIHEFCLKVQILGFYPNFKLKTGEKYYQSLYNKSKMTENSALVKKNSLSYQLNPLIDKTGNFFLVEPKIRYLSFPFGILKEDI
ncbi:hypothetical protein H312_02863 [Anncaliia algerae PRA339]|uniref:Uncharacterized protein n=1 Tax=Anncaliia algerae PRA339 TaxID=1288291 RepID=A0A059EXU8_9MICR|nr:hypothetical protein H312_02863 [Anncaliia algerae PRA339]